MPEVVNNVLGVTSNDDEVEERYKCCQVDFCCFLSKYRAPTWLANFRVDWCGSSWIKCSNNLYQCQMMPLNHFPLVNGTNDSSGIRCVNFSIESKHWHGNQNGTSLHQPNISLSCLFEILINSKRRFLVKFIKEDEEKTRPKVT